MPVSAGAREELLTPAGGNGVEMSDDIAAVCFDLDGTLLEYNQDGDEVLVEAFERAGVEGFCDVGVTNGERATQSVKLEALGVHDCFETHIYRTE